MPHEVAAHGSPLPAHLLQRLETSIAALAYRGRVAWIGNPAGHATGHRPEVWPLMEKNGTLLALFLAMEQSRSPERIRTTYGDHLTAGRPAIR